MRWLIALVALLPTGCLSEAEVLVYDTGTVGPTPTTTGRTCYHELAT